MRQRLLSLVLRELNEHGRMFIAVIACPCCCPGGSAFPSARLMPAASLPTHGLLLATESRKKLTAFGLEPIYLADTRRQRAVGSKAALRSGLCSLWGQG